jgi:hypothetical protein
MWSPQVCYKLVVGTTYKSTNVVCSHWFKNKNPQIDWFKAFASYLTGKTYSLMTVNLY